MLFSVEQANIAQDKTKNCNSSKPRGSLCENENGFAHIFGKPYKDSTYDLRAEGSTGQAQ